MVSPKEADRKSSIWFYWVVMAVVIIATVTASVIDGNRKIKEEASDVRTWNRSGMEGGLRFSGSSSTSNRGFVILADDGDGYSTGN